MNAAGKSKDEIVAQIVAELDAERAGLDADSELISAAAKAWSEAASEQEIYAGLAESLRQVVGDDAIISVSNLEELTQDYNPQVIVGLGPLVERMTALIGKHPIDLAGDYPVTVKALMTTGRLSRVDGGVVELAGETIPPAILRQAARLFGVEDAFVVGFAKGRFTGGVCIVTRRPNLVLRRATIEVLARLAAATIERQRTSRIH
jgi:hypothetical protein